MSSSSGVLRQTLIPNLPASIPVRYSRSSAAREEIRLLLSTGSAVMGIAAPLTATGGLQAIAFATSTQIVYLSVDRRNITGIISSAQEAFERLLSGRTKTLLAGFQMAYITLLISRVLGCSVRGVDLGTLFSKNTWEQKSPSALVRLKVCPNDRIDQFKVDGLWDVMEEYDRDTACLRAWVSACIAHDSLSEIKGAIKVDTSYLSTEQLACLARLCVEVHHLRSLRPSVTQNDNVEVKQVQDGYEVQNARYKNRLRKSYRTYVEMETSTGRIVTGRAVRAEGRLTQIKTRGTYSGPVQNIRVIGRQELNAAEKALDQFLLHVLQGQWLLEDSYFIDKIWFSRQYDSGTAEPLLLCTNSGIQLNASQREVVSAMVDDESPIVVAHGPPGTGKTTTISVAVSHWDNLKNSVWIAAQSNVAVKNIAESLAKLDVDFRLIVSKEFYVEWHEHLYGKVEERLIRSDEMPEDLWDVERIFGDTCVVLCTLSMLSNPVIEDRGIFSLVPPERLVIDEASQINISDFMPLFYKFNSHLIKVCFFGDPNQLPPYGQDQVPLKSVFEVDHLRRSAHFLAIQYRMPEPVGRFISMHVYNSMLQSVHDIQDMSCVRFVHVAHGFERKAGKSWRNIREAQTVVHLISHYYKEKKFVVVSPYDAQRTEIENQLKAAKLPWERVFNVDSFQ
ncbi:P-loop containing nucleoside triphosphate hydrolase protein, partial [Sparassis latifolia]